MERQMTTGLAWYGEEDYPAVLNVMSDAEFFPRSYVNWLERAEKTERRSAAEGTSLVRVNLHPAEFLHWCVLLNLRPNAEARMRFVQEALTQSRTVS